MKMNVQVCFLLYVFLISLLLVGNSIGDVLFPKYLQHPIEVMFVFDYNKHKKGDALAPVMDVVLNHILESIAPLCHDKPYKTFLSK